jgi:hypothetical protein
MKITKTYLRQVIKEELSAVLDEEELGGERGKFAAAEDPWPSWGQRILHQLYKMGTAWDHKLSKPGEGSAFRIGKQNAAYLWAQLRDAVKREYHSPSIGEVVRYTADYRRELEKVVREIEEELGKMIETGDRSDAKVYLDKATRDLREAAKLGRPPADPRGRYKQPYIGPEEYAARVRWQFADMLHRVAEASTTGKGRDDLWKTLKHRDPDEFVTREKKPGMFAKLKGMVGLEEDLDL